LQKQFKDKTAPQKQEEKVRSIDSYSSLVALLDRALTDHADRVACVSMGREMTYRELDERSRDWAAWLQSLGLEPKSRVAIMLPNVAASLVCLLGTLRAGYLVVNVNPLYTPRELDGQLKDCEADVIVVFESFAHVLQQVDPKFQPKTVVVVSPGALQPLPKRLLINFVAKHVKKRVPAWQLPNALSFESVLSKGHRAPFEPPTLLPDDVAILQYTGGTTGDPRGAMLTHRNVVANILQVEDIADPVLRDVMPNPLTMLTALPLYHVFAMTVCALYALHAGMRVVLVINPRDLPALIALWKKKSPHVFPAVNTLFAALLRQSAFRQVDFSNLRIALGGGMAVHPKVAQQ
jgi:long-chain acyl-CoA synthetase